MVERRVEEMQKKDIDFLDLFAKYMTGACGKGLTGRSQVQSLVGAIGYVCTTLEPTSVS